MSQGRTTQVTKDSTKKESIKSAVLVVLVISSLLLTGQIWFNKKLWPEGYNFFVNINTAVVSVVSTIFGVQEPPAPAQRNDIIVPTHFVAYTVKDFDHATLILNSSYSDFSNISDQNRKILSTALSKPSLELLPLNETEWRKALFTRGLYLDYGSAYPTSTFASFMGVTSCPISDTIANMRYFVITPADTFTNDVWVYIKDPLSGSVYRISSGLPKLGLEQILLSISADASPQNRFSFFLGTDSPSGDAGEVVFDPYLVLREEGFSLKTVSARNPIQKDGSTDLSAQTAERLLRTFSINPITVRPYIDIDNSYVFVYSRATLKLTTGGIIDYTTLQGDKGLMLEDLPSTSTMPAHKALTLANNFAQKILNITGNSDDIKLYCSSFSENQGAFVINFDYLYNGTPIKFTGAYSGMHAVTIELNGSNLKRYTHIVRSYEATETDHMLPSTYHAVDELFATFDTTENKNSIEEMLVYYDDDGNDGIKLPYWFIKLSGNDIYVR